MKTQLIKLGNSNVIINDEEIKEGDLCIGFRISDGVPYICQASPKKEKKNHRGIVIASDNSEHNLPGIDYNGFEEEFDLFDPEYKIKKALSYWKCFDEEYQKGFTDGLQLALEYVQSPHNDKKLFTLNNMFNCFVAGMDFEKEGVILKPDAHGYIKSLQQSKTFNIEIEKETSKFWTGMNFIYNDYPKIINNKIKIINILKE